MAVAFDVSQSGREANAIESTDGMARKAERGYVIGKLNAFDGSPTNVREPRFITYGLWGASVKQEM